jgi:hypothetical protein
MGDLACAVDDACRTARQMWHGRASTGKYSHPAMNAIRVDGTDHGARHQSAFGWSRSAYMQGRQCGLEVKLYQKDSEFRCAPYKRGMSHGVHTQRFSDTYAHRTQHDELHGVAIHADCFVEFWWRGVNVALCRR